MDKFGYYNNLKNLYEILDEMNIGKFLRVESLGNESLVSYKDMLEQFNRTLKFINENLNSFSFETLKEIDSFYTELWGFYSEVRQMDNVKFINDKQRIIERFLFFSDKFNSFYEKISGILNVKLNSKNLDDYIETVNSVRSDIEKQSEEITSKSEDLKNKLIEIDNIKNSVQSQLNEFRERYTPDNINLELINQQKLYGEESQSNRKESIIWIIAIFISTGTLVALIFYFINSFDDHLNEICVCTFKNFNLICPSCGQEVLWFYLIKHTLLRALLLSINIYVLKFCIKNYNACKHNQTINKQRQNSYGAALHFYNTIVSDKKDEILIMAANSIFTHQKTGYIEKGSEPNNPVLDRVVEKVQEITKVPKSGD